MSKSFMRPLRNGGVIGFVSPATAPDEAIYAFARDFVEARGYKARFFGRDAPQFGRMAADDQVRADAIHEAFASDDVSAIICTRGGYGSGRLIELLDYSVIEANPKPFVGYSDITNLLMEFHLRFGATTFHGPMMSDIMSKNDNWSIKQLFDVVSGKSTRLRLSESDATCLVPGSARGKLIGGNLSILCAMAGTTTFVPEEDVILLLEDVGEFMFRLDRCLVQIARTGLLDRAKAILISDMRLRDRGDNNSLGFSLEEVLDQHFGKLGIPIAYDLSAGHTDRQMTLPIGAWTQVHISENETEICFDHLWDTKSNADAA